MQEDQHGRGLEDSTKDALQYPQGPITRSKTKKFKDALQGFLKSIFQDSRSVEVQDKEEHMFVHVMQVEELCISWWHTLVF